MQTWNSAEAAQRYAAGEARRAAALADATARMIELAGIRPGMRVLDIAAGTGETTLLAAKRVGPSGSVVAVDISASMLAIAAGAARDAGFGNVETQVQDIAQLDMASATFDATISRLGLMFLDDPAAGVRRVRCALKAGARMAAIVWSTREANPYMSTAVQVVDELRGLPANRPAILRAFSLGPGDALERAFVQAGFSEVNVERVPMLREFASVDEAMDTLVNTSQNLPDLLEGATDAEHAEVLRRIRQRFAEFEQPDGRCVLPAEVVLASGVQPAECYDQSQ
jgi:ubiquinone/menaquinone biosynthesis C-methylase UbiE